MDSPTATRMPSRRERCRAVIQAIAPTTDEGRALGRPAGLSAGGAQFSADMTASSSDTTSPESLTAASPS
jgi:hypothetical protein